VRGSLSHLVDSRVAPLSRSSRTGIIAGRYPLFGYDPALRRDLWNLTLSFIQDGFASSVGYLDQSQESNQRPL
jgi:hypothetical protein